MAIKRSFGKRVSTSGSSSVTNKRLNVSATSFVDNLVFSRSSVWAFFRVMDYPYMSTSYEGKIQLAYDRESIYKDLMADRREPLDLMYIVANRPIDVDAVLKSNIKALEYWGGQRTAEFEKYLRTQEQFLRNATFKENITFVGVRVADRNPVKFDVSNALEGGMQYAVEFFKKLPSMIVNPVKDHVSSQEEERVRNIESRFYENLTNSGFISRRATPEELMLIIKKQFYPAMPYPALSLDRDHRYGRGDIFLETSHRVVNKLSYLEITQKDEHGEDMVGYRATLCLSDIPKVSRYPFTGPIMQEFSSSEWGEFDQYSYITLFPSEMVKKELAKQAKEQKDEVQNASIGLTDIDITVDGADYGISEAIMDRQTMSDEIEMDPDKPWVEANHRVIVEAPTLKELQESCAAIESMFYRSQIKLTWPMGDQAKLLLESMPGDKVRVPNYSVFANLEFVANNGAGYNNRIGDFTS